MKEPGPYDPEIGVNRGAALWCCVGADYPADRRNPVEFTAHRLGTIEPL
jgi:hypothetical protein